MAEIGWRHGDAHAASTLLQPGRGRVCRFRGFHHRGIVCRAIRESRVHGRLRLPRLYRACMRLAGQRRIEFGERELRQFGRDVTLGDLRRQRVPERYALRHEIREFTRHRQQGRFFRVIDAGRSRDSGLSRHCRPLLTASGFRIAQGHLRFVDLDGLDGAATRKGKARYNCNQSPHIRLIGLRRLWHRAF